MCRQKSTTFVPFVLICLNFNSKQIHSSEAPDLTMVVKAEAHAVQSYCIADGNVFNSAVGWVFPIPETKQDLPVTETSVVPFIRNDFDCNFFKGKPCTVFWQMEKWLLSDRGQYNLEPILDSRWAALPDVLTTENEAEEFTHRYEITPTFRAGISIRMSKNAEIFLCEGWNPENYPCYYINIAGENTKNAYLKKLKNLSHKSSQKLAQFHGENSLLSQEEWKDFVLALNSRGNLSLAKTYSGLKILNYNDQNPLKPLYLFIRSKHSNGLWKIHENQYMYTKMATTLKLSSKGVEIYGNQFCISLYVAMCDECAMNFYIFNKNRKETLQEISSLNATVNHFWREVRLLKTGVYGEKVDVYVETKGGSRNNFWAVDHVRICNKQEIRLMSITVRANEIADVQKMKISCQALKYEMWRPNKNPYSQIKEHVTNVSSTTSSIYLTLQKSVDFPEDHAQHFYVVQYEGRDLCAEENSSVPAFINDARRKSKGFLISKQNIVNITDLVPYTHYSVAFWDVIDGHKNYFNLNTQATGRVTEKELPKNVSGKVSESTARIKWDEPKCNETYGHLLYRVNLTKADFSYSKFVQDVKTEYVFDHLNPFANYTVEIVTVRDAEDLEGRRIVYNFTTSPGPAPKVTELEVYSTERNSVSMRFSLPPAPNGVPSLVFVSFCHPLYVKGCRTGVDDLQKCLAWPQFYCVQVDNLVGDYEYTFSLSIKNRNTSSFGDEALVVARTVDAAPGVPRNISHEMLECGSLKDYCHMNVTWLHPAVQRGAITMFHIILNETSQYEFSDSVNRIFEIYRIDNKKYQPRYSYVIRYVPYDAKYNLSVRAANDKYDGEFATIQVKTANIQHHLNQAPTFENSTNTTITFTIPQLDWRLRSGTVFVVVQDDNETERVPLNFTDVFEYPVELCKTHGKTWLAKALKLHDEPINVLIGSGTSSDFPDMNLTVHDSPLEPSTNYCVTFICKNVYKNSSNFAVYHERNVFTKSAAKQAPQSNRSVAVYVLLPVLMVIALLVWVGYRFYKKRAARSRRHNGDNIYESMPFEDYVPDSAYNETYDKLTHT